jgi:hypothetical protein
MNATIVRSRARLPRSPQAPASIGATQRVAASDTPYRQDRRGPRGPGDPTTPPERRCCGTPRWRAARTRARGTRGGRPLDRRSSLARHAASSDPSCFSFEPEELVDENSQHPSESECQQRRGTVLAGLDRADRLTADGGRLPELFLRQIALRPCDPESVLEADIKSGRHAATVNQPACDVKYAWQNAKSSGRSRPAARSLPSTEHHDHLVMDAIGSSSRGGSRGILPGLPAAVC